MCRVKKENISKCREEEIARMASQGGFEAGLEFAGVP